MQRGSVWTALRSPRTRHDLARGAATLGWLLALAMLFFTCTRWFDAGTRHPVLIAAATAAPVMLLPAWAVLLIAAVGRRILLTGLALLLCVVQVQVAWPLLHDTRGLDAAQRAPSALQIRIMTLNVHYTVDDGAAVSRQVRAVDPDVVVLNELSALTLLHLDLSEYPYAYVHPDRSGVGFGVWSRWPVHFEIPPSLRFEPAHLGYIHPPGRRFALVQVHTRSPVGSDRARIWQNQLRYIPQLAASAASPVVVVGDFNASRSSHAFGGLLGGPGGFADVADGRGYLATWPGDIPGVPPLLRLDHIIVSREFGVRDARVLGPTGSDHRAVLADLALA